jgi:four helix bundle protein
MTGKNALYIELEDLEVYKIARKLSSIAWKIYDTLDWSKRKTMGDQFLESTDSVGANIAEGYGRYHYLDKIKFYYNSRGSFLECKKHWLSLLQERKCTNEELIKEYETESKDFLLKLNNFISATYKAKYGEKS